MSKTTKDLLEFWEDQMKLSHKSSNYFFRKSPSHYHMMLLVMTAYKLKQAVVDTTGAGDAFNGAFAVGLANDLDIKEALSFANKVAGISTTRLGAASSMPFAKELTDN